MSDFLDDLKGPEETPPPSNGTPVDSELEAILQGYKTAPPAPLGEQNKPDTNSPGVAPLPFLSHDSSLAPKVEYYKTGKKAGQPKPPKKGQAPPLNPAGQLSIQATTFITGAVFVTMIDMIIPLFMVGIYNFVQGRKKRDFKPLDYEKVQMTPKQKSDLGMVADAVVRELKLSGSPSFLFFLGLAGVYFMNFILQKSLADSEAFKKQANETKNTNMANNPPNSNPSR